MIGRFTATCLFIVSWSAHQHVDNFVKFLVRPVFQTNGSLKLEVEDEEHPFHITASAARFSRGDTAVLGCPAKGYPPPTIIWYKGDSETPLGKKNFVC